MGQALRHPRRTRLRAKPRGCTLHASTHGASTHAKRPYLAEQYPAIRHIETRRFAVDLLLALYLTQRNCGVN